MSTDVTGTFLNVLKVRIPTATAQPDGSWLETWHVETSAEGAVDAQALEKAGRTLSSDEARVEIERLAPKSFALKLRTKGASNGAQLSFVYEALKAFENVVAPIVKIEGVRKELWTPFRNAESEP